jgi:hypothetical protein
VLKVVVVVVVVVVLESRINVNTTRATPRVSTPDPHVRGARANSTQPLGTTDTFDGLSDFLYSSNTQK